MRVTGIMMVLAALIVAVAGCEPQQTVDENTPGEAEGEVTAEVLLAVTQSEFKQAVAEAVQSQLSEMGHEVENVDTKKVDTAGLADYEVVVLIDAARGGIFTEEGKKVYEAMKDSPEDLVVMFSIREKDKDWKKYEEKGIDAVTAASNMDQVQAAAEKVVAKTRAALGETE